MSTNGDLSPKLSRFWLHQLFVAAKSVLVALCLMMRPVRTPQSQGFIQEESGLSQTVCIHMPPEGISFGSPAIALCALTF